MKHGNQLEEMARQLDLQSKRLKELEVKLQKERQAKANLEEDFQHVLDQLEMISEPQVVCL